jgi:hypothetical protein
MWCSCEDLLMLIGGKSWKDAAVPLLLQVTLLYANNQ